MKIATSPTSTNRHLSMPSPTLLETLNDRLENLLDIVGRSLRGADL